MKSRLKVLSVSLAVLGLLTFGFYTQSQAATTNAPSAASPHNTFVFVPSSTVFYVDNTGTDPSSVKDSTLQAGSVLYGWRIIATSANGGASIYDDADVQNIDQSGVSTDMIDELVEATANQEASSDWAGPVQLQNGFSLITDNTPTVIIQYE